VRKRTLFAPVAALVAVLLTLAPGAVAGSGEGGVVLSSPTGAWFVQLKTSAADFESKAKAAGIGFTKRFEYTRLWKGVSVGLNDQGDAARLTKVEGVEAVFPVLPLDIGPTDVISPELNYALALSGADVAQETHGFTGAGIKVGVIDSGVDYHHPDLGGGFGPGKKVITGWDFVGDRFNASGRGGDELVPHPDNDPDDCARPVSGSGGHGTHVAGIIGAKPAKEGGIKGVAPDVQFGAYRVFGCEGSTTTDIMQAAMERAVADGMDVINMSIGSAFYTWPEYPSAVAADAAADAGAIVVASIGNSGRDGVYSAGAPGVGQKVIGVASFDNSHIELIQFKVSPDDKAIGYNNAVGEVDPADNTKPLDAPTTGSALMARTGTQTTTNDACTTLSADTAAKVNGRIALIRRGTCTFRTKVLNAQAAGAIGVVLYNNSPGAFGATVAGATPAGTVTIPVVTVAASADPTKPGDGETLDNRIAAAEATPSTDDDVQLTWTDQKGFAPNVTSGQASSFTSYGLEAYLRFKPNIGAPGGFITSTYPLEKEGGAGKATLSGTSMSSPHVAGTVALLLSARADLKGKWKDVMTILQNSADPVPWTVSATQREPAHRQGAGMVDIDDAICMVVARPTCPNAEKVVVAPGQWALGEGTAAQTQTLTLTNNSSTSVTYNITHLRSLGTASTFVPTGATAPVTVLHNAGMTPSASTVTVPAGGTATVTVTITPPTLAANALTGALINPEGAVYGGWIQFTKSGTTAPALRVPYAGFRGDYQGLAALTDGACESTPFPAIFKAGGETECKAASDSTPAAVLTGFTKQAAGATFNVDQREDRPVLLYQVGHQVRRLEIRAVNQATNQEFLVAFADYFRRTATNDLTVNGFFVYTWDGKYIADNGRTTNRRAVPTGSYKLKLVATEAKAFNALGEADSFESRTTNAFVVTRG